MLEMTPARVMGWLVVLAAFVAVWLTAREAWILFVALPVLLPVQFWVCREILLERGYSTWIAAFSLVLVPLGVLIAFGIDVFDPGFSLLLAPMGVLTVLGLPRLSTDSKDA